MDWHQQSLKSTNSMPPQQGPNSKVMTMPSIAKVQSNTSIINKRKLITTNLTINRKTQEILTDAIPYNNSLTKSTIAATIQVKHYPSKVNPTVIKEIQQSSQPQPQLIEELLSTKNQKPHSHSFLQRFSILLSTISQH